VEWETYPEIWMDSPGETSHTDQGKRGRGIEQRVVVIREGGKRRTRKAGGGDTSPLKTGRYKEGSLHQFSSKKRAGPRVGGWWPGETGYEATRGQLPRCFRKVVEAKRTG